MRLKTVVYLPGDIIMRKGEQSYWMGFIGRGGKVAILDPTQEKRRVIKILHEGDYIGELALLFSIKRTADVEAFTLVRMHVLTQDDYWSVKKLYPLDSIVLHREMERYLVTRKRYSSTELESMKDAATKEQQAWSKLKGLTGPRKTKSKSKSKKVESRDDNASTVAPQIIGAAGAAIQGAMQRTASMRRASWAPTRRTAESTAAERPSQQQQNVRRTSTLGSLPTAGSGGSSPLGGFGRGGSSVSPLPQHRA
jgi:CRP-like cAMP-binding protein